MNKQEVFNTVKKHLLTQNAKSMNEVGDCAYRGLHKRKCAIGIFIPDNLYTYKLEMTTVNFVWALIFPYEILSMYDRLFLHSLRNVHDECEVDDWERELKVVAEKWNLKYES